MQFEDLLAQLISNPEVFATRNADNKYIFDIRGIHNETLLHYCSVEGMSVQVKTLLKMGFNPNVVSKYGTTPLMDAATNGHTDVVNILLNNGADTKIKDKIGYTVVEKLGLLAEDAQMLKLVTDFEHRLH
jgi:ankyrin repeat protein